MSTEFFNDQWRIPSNENQNKISNYSMDFDGTSTEIDLGSSVLFDSTKGFSVSAWVNLTSYSPQYPVIIKTKTDQSTDFILGLSNASSYAGVIIGSSSNFLTGRTAGNISGDFIGTWKHVCLTFNGVNRTALSSYKIYVDGSSVTLTSTGSFAAISRTNSKIGTSDYATNRFNGKIDQVTIFDYELSPIQVASLGLDGYAFNFPNRANPAAQAIFLNNQAQVFNNATNFSFSGWFKIDYNENQNIFDIKSGSNKRFQINYYSSTQGLRINIDTSGAGNYADRQNVISNGYIAFGEWFHYAGVFNGSGATNADRVKLYINGQPVSLFYGGTQATSLGAIGATNTIQIGQSINNTFKGFRGDAGNIQMWDASLLPSEVTTLYNNGKPLYTGTQPQASNMQFWYKLDGSQDTFNGSQWTLKDNGIVGQDALSSGMTSSNLIASDINGELIANPMITSPKPIAYYQLGDQSVSTGPTSDYLVPNNSLSDYVFDFGTTNESINLGSYFPYPSTVTDKWSFSCWIKLNSTSSYGYILSSYIPNANGLVVTLRGGADLGMVQATIRGQNSTQYAAVKTNNTLPLNEWKHVVATYDGNAGNAFTAFTIYINGNTQPLTPFGATSQSGSMINSYDKYIGQGAYGNPGSNYLTDCDLAQLSFFHYELSSSQVDTLYNNGAPGDISSLNPKRLYKLNASEVFNSTSTEWSVDNNAYPSVYKSSLNFDGNNDALTIQNSSTFNLGTAFTISGWFNFASNKYQGLVSFDATSGGSPRGWFLFQIDTNNDIRLFDGTNVHTLKTSYTTTNQWDSFIITYDGTDLVFYINGNQESTQAVSVDLQTNGNDGRIGNNQFASGRFFDGKMSNIAFWNVGLTSTQVETLYNNGTPEASISHSPVSWWKLDNTTTGLIDNGSASNNGTNNGATEYVGFVNELAGESLGMNSANLVVSDLQQTSGYSPYALDFDGADDYLNTGNHSIFQITGAMTVSYWFNGQGGSGTVGGFGKLGGSNNRGFCLGLNNNNNITFYIAPTINSLVAATYSHTADNNWHHLLGVFTPSTSLELYFDGVLVATTSTSVSSQYNGSNNLQIGARGDNLGTFNGKISNAAIWNTSLTFTEVTEIYNQGVPSNLNTFSGTAPISWWQLGSNSSYNSGLWTCLNEIGDKNFQSAGNMTNSDIVDGPGYSASGLGTSSIDIKGDAPYSTANGLSENMDVLDRTLDTPIVNTHSIQLDGVDGAYVDFGNVNIFERTDAFSGSCWINLASSASTGMFISKSKNSTIVGYQFYVTATRDIIFFIGDFYSNNYLLARTVNSINASTWYNVAFTYSGSSARTGIKLYVNGVAQSLSYQGPTSITGSIVDSSVPFQISGRDGANLVLDGKIDEVAMFNSELSAPQVASIYNNGTPNNILPLNPVSWHRFESLTTNSGVVTTADSSVNGLTGTVENGAVLSTIVP